MSGCLKRSLFSLKGAHCVLKLGSIIIICSAPAKCVICNHLALTQTFSYEWPIQKGLFFFRLPLQSFCHILVFVKEPGQLFYCKELSDFPPTDRVMFIILLSLISSPLTCKPKKGLMLEQTAASQVVMSDSISQMWLLTEYVLAARLPSNQQAGQRKWLTERWSSKKKSGKLWPCSSCKLTNCCLYGSVGFAFMTMRQMANRHKLMI